MYRPLPVGKMAVVMDIMITGTQIKDKNDQRVLYWVIFEAESLNFKCFTFVPTVHLHDSSVLICRSHAMKNSK